MIGWWGAPLSQCLTTAEQGHILDETGCKNLFSFWIILECALDCVYMARISSWYPFTPAILASSLTMMNLLLTSLYNRKIQLKTHC